MGRVDLYKNEIIEIKYVQDMSFKNGSRQEKFCKSFKGICYGVVYFKNGLKLRINNDGIYNKIIFTKNNTIQNNTKYKVYYNLKWEGKTRYNNGDIVCIVEEDGLFPYENILKDYKNEIPLNIKLYINEKFKNDKRAFIINLLNLNYKMYNLKEKKWLWENLFKKSKNTKYYLAIRLFEIIHKEDFGYKGLNLYEAKEHFENRLCEEIGGLVNIEDAWGHLIELHILTKNSEERYYPSKYAD